jgi:type II secretory pathway pseudopilin PulG
MASTRIQYQLPAAVAAQRGFTYLWLLFILAAGAAGLAAIGQRASIAVQRDREAELIFRGREIAHAIAAYWAATPGDIKSLPMSLQDLLEDRRGPQTTRHLRRVYSDPFTGQPDWVLVTTDDGRISGVHSRAAVVALRSVDLPTPKAGARARVSDRKFLAAIASASAATSAASGATSARPGSLLPETPATQGPDEPPNGASE